MIPQVTENISEYHAVFAGIIGKVVETIANKDAAEAKRLLTATIILVYTIKRAEDEETTPDTIQKEIINLKLDKKSIEELMMLMAYHQARIGITPRQKTNVIAERWKRFKR